MTTAIVTSLLSAAAAFIGAWLAAQLALNRFRHERIWERRAAAYTAVFDALHHNEKWLDMLDDPEVRHDDKLKAETAGLAARDAIFQKVDSEIWLMSDAFFHRFIQLTDELGTVQSLRSDSACVEAAKNAFTTAIRDLRKIARQELGVS
jgi:hypothetical protein